LADRYAQKLAMNFCQLTGFYWAWQKLVKQNILSAVGVTPDSLRKVIENIRGK
jgi:ATP-dependent Clp protease ATP-binding subunit ClpB